MTGTIDDANVDDARTRQASDQTSLYGYGGTPEETFVGIVESANEEIREVCDFIDPMLAPDYDLFVDWIARRDNLRSNEGLSDREAHNRAFRKVEYRDRFLDDLSDDIIDAYAKKVLDGENIVLVCYCNNGRLCHRKIVKEKIHERLG